MTKDAPLVFDCVLPAGLSIVTGEHGRMIRAVTEFKAGDLVGMGRFYLAEPNINAYTLRVADANDADAPLREERCTEVHTCYDSDLSRRRCFTWDGFINHSCDPNCRWQAYPDDNAVTATATAAAGGVAVAVTTDFGEYRVEALRDIAAGEEITNCYSMEDWQDETGRFENGFPCGCGAAACVGLAQEYFYRGAPTAAYEGPLEGFSQEFLRVNPWVHSLAQAHANGQVGRVGLSERQ